MTKLELQEIDNRVHGSDLGYHHTETIMYPLIDVRNASATSLASSEFMSSITFWTWFVGSFQFDGKTAAKLH